MFSAVLNFIRRLWSTQKSRTEMTPPEIGERLTIKVPISVRPGLYSPPQHQCSRWILIHGPVYLDQNFLGTVIVEAPKMVKWMAEHAKGVFSSDVAEQQAREFLPGWLGDADPHDETVTLLDEKQREVLQGDCLRFLWSDWARVWCPTCKAWHPRISEHDFGWVQTGRITIKFDDWHCPVGHLIHREKQEKLRLIVR